MAKIGFGGGCHWCTEAVFSSLKGVQVVNQGWIASCAPSDTFSEAVVVTFDEHQIDLQSLIEIHLHTHKSTSDHSMRAKYRSAVYFFQAEQQHTVDDAIVKIQSQFKEKIITQSLPFQSFKASDEQYKNYYYNQPEKPFCTTYITPKLNLLLRKFSKNVNTNKLSL